MPRLGHRNTSLPLELQYQRLFRCVAETIVDRRGADGVLLSRCAVLRLGGPQRSPGRPLQQQAPQVHLVCTTSRTGGAPLFSLWTGAALWGYCSVGAAVLRLGGPQRSPGRPLQPQAPQVHLVCTTSRTGGAPLFSLWTGAALWGYCSVGARCSGWVFPGAHPGAHFSRRRRKCTLCALPRGPVVPPYFHCERARRYVAPTRVAAFAQLLRASTAYGAVAVISPCFLGQF